MPFPWRTRPPNLARSTLKADSSRNHVYVVCSPDRSDLYGPVAAGSPLELRIVPSVSEAVRGCVCDPGRAVIIDMVTTLHAGVSETAPLYDLGIDLPVLRCNQSESGAWTAMCQAPFKRVQLPLALQEIADRDPSWRHPTFLRRYVRVPLLSRVRFRISESETWHRGNCSNASVSGLFLLSLDTQPIGTELDIELLDAGAESTKVRGMVTWFHAWEDGPHLPGMGLDFDLASVSTSFREFLAECYLRRKS